VPKTKTEIRYPFKDYAFITEVVSIMLIAMFTFWFAQEHDAFEYLVGMSREHEEWELDEIFTLLMISAFALVFVVFRNGVYLKREIKRRAVIEEEIKKLAFFDSLTGLPNRDLCNNRLEHTLAHASRFNNIIAVLFIDLDNFKEINDTCGHDGGDELLKQVATRLSSNLRASDTLARIAGDEFIIVQESLSKTEDVTELAEKLLRIIAQPFLLERQEAYVGLSIGIAFYPNDANNAESLIKYADTAMYQAKNEGKNTFRFFSAELDQQAKAKQRVIYYLRKALENNEFILNYQPVIDVKTNKIKGAEVLLRWHNDDLGNITPDIFIPMAEDLGIISAIGDWVLMQACLQTKRWQLQGYSPIVISVNMSARQLNSDNYAATVESCLLGTELAAKYLELELTETAIMKDIKQASKQLRELQALGIAIALDDFGTGYSSMSYLCKLKLTRLKIDRSFIKNIPCSEEDIITTNAIISLANNLNLKITAEGIETKAQQEFIANTSVDSAQGYYFSKPVDAESFEKLLGDSDKVYP
jgi:diguanylate cyclase (GGDEF)-like protein